jgi:hypothetical protein
MTVTIFSFRWLKLRHVWTKIDQGAREGGVGSSGEIPLGGFVDDSMAFWNDTADQ